MTIAREAIAAFRALPLHPIDTVLALGPWLVLAPHPDDESLGCGGLIAAACAAGQPPLVVIVTDGAASHPGSQAYPPPSLAALREQEARDAVDALGLPPGRLAFLRQPDTRSPLDGPALDSVAATVAEHVRQHQLRGILAPWAHDPHCDHLSAHRIARRAAAETGARHLAYPVWGWTLPCATPLPSLPTGRRIDVSAELAKKRRAIAAHRSQYAGLITDDPAGFQLRPEMLALFQGPFETLLDVSRDDG